MFKKAETGLKDKKGVLIKEGDLILESLYDPYEKETVTAKYKVIYSKRYAAFGFQSIKYKSNLLFFGEDSPYHRKDFEVINEK